MKKGRKKGIWGSYNFFIIPEDHSRVRKFRLNPFQLRLLVASLSLVVLFVAFNALGFWYYRFLHVSFEKERVTHLQYRREKNLLMEKIRRLEEMMEATEDYAGKLAGLVGTERPKMKKGVGPLPVARFELRTRAPEVSLAALEPKLDQMEERAAGLEERMSELYHIEEDKVLYAAATPSIWPVKGWVTSDYGMRRSPFSLERDFHRGMDIAARYGAPVRAAGDGVVTYSNYKGGYGKTVVIDHGYGISTHYAHNSKLAVKVGDRVKRGDLVATVGNTGHSTGPHLHYEIHVDGVAIDPAKYILQ